MAHIGQELTLGSIGVFSSFLGGPQLLLGAAALADLHIESAGPLLDQHGQLSGALLDSAQAKAVGAHAAHHQDEATKGLEPQCLVEVGPHSSSYRR